MTAVLLYPFGPWRLDNGPFNCPLHEWCDHQATHLNSRFSGFRRPEIHSLLLVQTPFLLFSIFSSIHPQRSYLLHVTDTPENPLPSMSNIDKIHKQRVSRFYLQISEKVQAIPGSCSSLILHNLVSPSVSYKPIDRRPYQYSVKIENAPLVLVCGIASNCSHC